jgi:hypothetical protein
MQAKQLWKRMNRSASKNSWSSGISELCAGIEDNQNKTKRLGRKWIKREYLGNFLACWNITIFSGKELPYTQSFMVRSELHCFLAVFPKPYRSAYQPLGFQSLIELCSGLSKKLGIQLAFHTINLVHWFRKDIPEWFLDFGQYCGNKYIGPRKLTQSGRTGVMKTFCRRSSGPLAESFHSLTLLIALFPPAECWVAKI